MRHQIIHEANISSLQHNIKTKIKFRNDPSILSDVCFFSSYSFSGVVEEYVYYYLKELKKAGFSIVFISTSALQEKCVDRLSEYVFLIIERENKCPDFGSWKVGLSMLNWGKKLNSVLLVNDSVFGPFFDLGDIISPMKKKYDVWGMTDSYEVEYHLQSYFLYFNKTAIASEVFTKFWRNVDLSASKEEVIYKYEVGLSGIFARSNLQLGAYASIDMLSKNAVHGHKIINPTLVFWKSLIKEHQFPFLKRELIIKMNISKTYFNIDLYINVGTWKRMIAENSTYQVSYVDDFIRNYYKSIKAINSNIVLRKRKILFLTHDAEIGGDEKLLVSFLCWLKSETDINIEILICKKDSDELVSEFGKLGVVTNFYTLNESGRINLKERLIDEVALVFSNTIENLHIQKFLTFLDVPQIIFVHKPISMAENVLFVNENILWARNNVTRFIASSNLVKQNIVEYFGIDEKNVELIHQFVDPYPVEEFEKDHQKTKSNLGIPSDAFIVGMSGSFDWKNSADLLPIIGAHLCREYDNIHIVWLGVNSNSTLYQSIKFDLKRAGLTKKIHLVEQKIDTRPFYAILDVFVMCSRENSFPLSNLESALAGKPVIYFQDSGSCSEYSSLGIGHSVPYLDINALANKVLFYYNNRTELEIEKGLMSQIVRNKFTTAIQAPKILQLIDNYFDQKELTFIEDPLVTFMTHIYYEDSWDEIRNKLKNFDNGENHFLFSISESCLIKEQIIADIKRTFKKTYSLITSNIGKDIGGKMALIDLYLLLDIKSSYIVFLHDKQSPHSVLGESWKNGLFKIIDPNNQKRIQALFKDPATGIVGSKDHIINEYDNTSDTFRNNNRLSKKLLAKFDMSIRNYDFLGGAIYWLRSSIVENFFAKNHPILMREDLEAGNVLDLHDEKMAHTWERMFSWIATQEGFNIKGI
jgi:lipopolysaccharide biosynthesis protein